MLNHLANIKKLFLLGFAVASTKVMLLLFAYYFDSETYNRFNQIYYTASMVILFGSLGFNIAVTRINMQTRMVISAVFITTSAAYLFLQILSSPFENIFEIIAILIYCLFISISGIYVFQLLFSGKYRTYVFLTLSYSVLHLLIIPSTLFLHLDFFEVLPAIAVLWFVIGFPNYIKQSSTSTDSLKEFYKIGVSAFVINSAVSLALAADKYFVNHFFPVEIANSYTFSWGLTAPMFYIGVLIEQFLFSEINTSKANILKRGFILSTALVIIYAAMLLLAVNAFPALIPASVDYKLVIKIYTMMMIGYSLYVIIHFPVNAYLFKSLGTNKQKIISIVFSIIISAYLILYISMVQGVFVIDYVLLMIITWSYIFTLLISKIFIMFGKPGDETNYKSILEIQNIEP